MKRVFTLLMIAGLSLGFGLPARADHFAGFVKNGLNSLSDDSIEAYFNTSPSAGSGSGSFGVGSVLAGVIKINNINGTTTGVDQHVYLAFASQVTAIGGTPANPTVSFGAVTQPGLTLTDLTGKTINPGATFALFTSPSGYVDDVLTTAGATAAIGGGPANIQTLMTYVANNGSLEFSVGPTGGTDFQEASVQPGGLPLIAPPTNPTPGVYGTGTGLPYLGNIGTPTQIALVNVANTVLDNNTGLTFHASVPVVNLLTGTTSMADAGITSGTAIGGEEGTGFVNYPLYSTNGGVTTGGIQYADGGGNDNGTLTVEFTGIAPEPSSLVLFGLGFAGLAGSRFLRRRKAAQTA